MKGVLFHIWISCSTSEFLFTTWIPVFPSGFAIGKKLRSTATSWERQAKSSSNPRGEQATEISHRRKAWDETRPARHDIHRKQARPQHRRSLTGRPNSVHSVERRSQEGSPPCAQRAAGCGSGCVTGLGEASG